jgi:hypothetical protein
VTAGFEGETGVGRIANVGVVEAAGGACTGGSGFGSSAPGRPGGCAYLGCWSRTGVLDGVPSSSSSSRMITSGGGLGGTGPCDPSCVPLALPWPFVDG